MGYLYKLKPEIIKFIIAEKLKNQNISCRELASLASNKFSIKLSKSSINNIIKNEKLSSSIGRRTKLLLNIEGGVDHGGFGILQAIDSYLDLSKLLAELLSKFVPGRKLKSEDMENVIQGLIIFKSIFNLNIEFTRCYNNKEIWTLIGRRPTKIAFRQAFELLQNSQPFINEIVNELRQQLIPVTGFKFQLRDGGSFYVDAGFQNIWSTPQRRSQFLTHYKSNSYIKKFISGERILSVFHSQGTHLFSSQEVLNFVLGLNGQDRLKQIRQIELIGPDNKVVETRIIVDSDRRFFLLGFWPWQLEIVSDLERKPAKERFSWTDLGIELYYQIEEVSLPQHIAEQEVKLNIVLLKDNPLGAVRIGILTNLPSDIIHNYLSCNELYHWFAPEERYKKLKNKSADLSSETFLDLPEMLGFLSETNKEHFLDGLFDLLSKIIFNYFQYKILPESCWAWNPLKIKEVFLRQKAIIKRSKSLIVHNIIISNELCKGADLKYVCQRLNELGIRDSQDRLLWIK